MLSLPLVNSELSTRHEHNNIIKLCFARSLSLVLLVNQLIYCLLGR